MCEPVTLGAIATAATTWGSFGAGAAAATATTAATTGLTLAQALSLGASVGGTVMSAAGMYQQSKMAEATARNNARSAEIAAQDADRRSEQEANVVRRKGAAIESAQRAAFAGKGLDISYGTAADIQDQTDFFTQSDVATTRSNGDREAWNIRAKGQQALAMGKADSLNSLYGAAGTMLGGAGQVADKWYAYTKPRTAYAYGAGGGLGV